MPLPHFAGFGRTVQVGVESSVRLGLLMGIVRRRGGLAGGWRRLRGFLFLCGRCKAAGRRERAEEHERSFQELAPAGMGMVVKMTHGTPVYRTENRAAPLCEARQGR